MMRHYLAFAISSFVAGCLLLFLVKTVSAKLGFLNQERKVPFTGGLAFSLAFIIPYFYFVFSLNLIVPFQLLYLLVFAFLLLLVEIIDDFKDLPLKARVLIQLVFVALFLLYGKRVQIYFFPFWVNYLLSFLWIMGITNAFNLLDIGDGLCGGVSFFIGLAFFSVSVIKGNFLLAGLFASLSGAILAFNIFNFPPAKIFMGNSGSHFLGFLFASLSIYGDYATFRNPISLVVPLLILSFPIIDTIYLILARVNKKIIPLRKSNDHIFLQLLIRGYHKKRALLITYLITLFWCISGVFVANGFNYLFLTYLVFALVANVFLLINVNRPV